MLGIRWLNGNWSHDSCPNILTFLIAEKKKIRISWSLRLEGPVDYSLWSPAKPQSVLPTKQTYYYFIFSHRNVSFYIRAENRRNWNVFGAQCSTKGGIYWVRDAQLRAIAGPYSALQGKVNPWWFSQNWKPDISWTLTWNQDDSEHARKTTTQQDFWDHTPRHWSNHSHVGPWISPITHLINCILGEKLPWFLQAS